MEIKGEILDELIAGYQKPEDLIGENGLLKQLTKRLVERALKSELTHHLGYGRNEDAAAKGSNRRNGTSRKTLKGDFGDFEIEVPRDRESTFEPVMVAKNQTRWTGFDDKILSMYARGMSTREIQGHLRLPARLQNLPFLGRAEHHSRKSRERLPP
jgi:transposase-like protein